MWKNNVQLKLYNHFLWKWNHVNYFDENLLNLDMVIWLRDSLHLTITLHHFLVSLAIVFSLVLQKINFSFSSLLFSLPLSPLSLSFSETHLSFFICVYIYIMISRCVCICVFVCVSVFIGVFLLVGGAYLMFWWK